MMMTFLRMYPIHILIVIIALLDMRCTPSGQHQSNGSASEDASVPPIPDSLRQAMNAYQNSRSATLVDWGPGGRGMVILTRFAETNQIHFVAAPGAYRRQVTFLSESVISASVCPDSSQPCILFTQDSGGDENFQIYALRLDSMRISRITDGQGQNEGVVWSNRGQRFVYVGNRRNGTDFDLCLSDTRHPERARLILTAGGAWSAHDWSPDDQRLLVSKYLSRTRSYLFILDPISGAMTALHDTTDTVSQESGAWGPGGEGVFLTSDEGTDFRALRYYDCTTHREKVLTAEIPWDVREIALSRDRKRVAFTVNEHGFSRVYLMDARTFGYRQVPGLPQGVIAGLRFHPDGNRLGLTINLPTQPEDAYSLDLRDFSLRRWTESELGGIAASSLVAPQIISYPTYDSIRGAPRRIHCFYYRPVNRPAPLPVLIQIHGGPESQYWPYFTPMTQFLVNEFGVAVLAPNVRGSGGYGKRYLDLDNGMRREDALRDIGALLDWIESRPELDTARIAVLGGSYGGYLSLAAMTHYCDRLRAGIDEYGISNFITFLTHTSPYRRDLRRVEYGDERDPTMREFLQRISPVSSAERITKPLLIIQGANDARVPAQESQQIAAAVRRNGGTVWMFMPGDEGHGFRKKANRDTQDLTIALFLKRFLIP